MPIVLRVGGFALSFYAGDHDPPHVHVRYSGAEAVIEIETGSPRKVAGMRYHDVDRACALVLERQEQLLAAWNAWKAERRT